MFKNRLAHVIREVTIAPVVTAIMLIILYAARPDIFGSGSQFVLSLLFLSVLPLTVYPIYFLVPKNHNKGKSFLRSLTILMDVAGYVFGFVAAIISKAPNAILIVYITYLLSGIAILVLNKVFHIKASGHACGIVGPVLYMWYMMGPVALFGLILVALVFAATLQTKEHTVSQLGWGSITAAVSLALAIGVMSILP